MPIINVKDKKDQPSNPIGLAPVVKDYSGQLRPVADDIKILGDSILKLRALIIKFKKESLSSLGAYLKSKESHGKSIDDIAHYASGLIGNGSNSQTLNEIKDTLAIIYSKINITKVTQVIGVQSISEISRMVTKVNKELGLGGGSNIGRNTIIDSLNAEDSDAAGAKKIYDQAVKTYGPSLGIHTIGSTLGLYYALKGALSAIGTAIESKIQNPELNNKGFVAKINSEGNMLISTPSGGQESMIDSRSAAGIVNTFKKTFNDLGLRGAYEDKIRIIDSLPSIVETSMGAATLVSMIEDFNNQFGERFRSIRNADLKQVADYINSRYDQRYLTEIFNRMVLESGTFGDVPDFPFDEDLNITYMATPEGSERPQKYTDGTIKIEKPSGGGEELVYFTFTNSAGNEVKFSPVRLKDILALSNTSKTQFYKKTDALQFLYYQLKKYMMKKEMGNNPDILENRNKSMFYNSISFNKIYKELSSAGKISQSSRIEYLYKISTIFRHEIPAAKKRKEQLEKRIDRLKRLDQSDQNVVDELADLQRQLDTLNIDLKRHEDVENIKDDTDAVQDDESIKIELKDLVTKDSALERENEEVINKIESGFVTVPKDLYDEYLGLIINNKKIINNLNKQLQLIQKMSGGSASEKASRIEEINRDIKSAQDEIARLHTTLGTIKPEESGDPNSLAEDFDPTAGIFDTEMKQVNKYFTISRDKVKYVKNARKNLENRPNLKIFIQQEYPEFMEALESAEKELNINTSKGQEDE